MSLGFRDGDVAELLASATVLQASVSAYGLMPCRDRGCGPSLNPAGYSGHRPCSGVAHRFPPFLRLEPALRVFATTAADARTAIVTAPAAF